MARYTVSEEEIKAFLKDKVDWKFFTYLLDLVVSFEDEGYLFFVMVVYNDKVMYEVYTGMESYNLIMSERMFNFLIHQERKELEYKILCVNEEGNDELAMQKIDEYEKKLNPNKTLGYEITKNSEGGVIKFKKK